MHAVILKPLEIPLIQNLPKSGSSLSHRGMRSTFPYVHAPMPTKCHRKRTVYGQGRHLCMFVCMCGKKGRENKNETNQFGEK